MSSAQALLAAAALLVCAACGSPRGGNAPPGDGRPSFPSDPAARARLEAVKSAMGPLRDCPPACLETLEGLHSRYSADDEVVELLRAVYLQHKDWDALIGLEEARPEGQRSHDDRKRLAEWYYRKGRYRDAGILLERLIEENPEDAGLARLSGLALFQSGETERAASRLESALSRLTGTEAAEAATALGLIHLHRGELPLAEQALERAVTMDAEYAPAYSALGRVLSARGEASRARQALDRSAALRSRIAAQESRALRLSAQSRLASQAVEERRWDDGERIIQEMLPDADASLRIKLYRYLAEVRSAAGRAAAAQDALRKADELSREGAGR
jgi:tetratricopeptide (TPR) repeat protein